MDQYFYQWFYQQSKPTMQNHFKSIAWCWVTTTNLSIQGKAKTKCSSFSVIRYSELIHTYFHIWIIWYSNAFLIVVCFHISSFSFIQSIQIIMSLIIVTRIHCLAAFIDLWQQWYFQQYDYHNELILPFLR